MNASPRGREKHKKAHMTMEEGEDDEDTKEVFGVPRVMVEEQCNALGMLTQVLAQVVERMVAMEACDEERLAMEQETIEIHRAHLAMARRATDCEEEWLELERVQLSIAQQQTEDLWKMGCSCGPHLSTHPRERRGRSRRRQRRRRGERRQTTKTRMHREKRSSRHM